MLKREAIIRNKKGLHARPAKLFMMEAVKYTANISLHHNDRIAEGKSMISLLQLCARQGEKVLICADGIDEEKAIEALTHLLQREDE